MTSPVVVEEFRAQHRRIEEHLSACDAVLERVEALHARLKEMRPLLLEHFDQKDAFYVKLRELCAHNGDLASSNIAKIFDDNMRVQSGAIRRFFNALDTSSSPLLAQSFKTMGLIIRSRLSTEERAVFPLYVKNGGT